MTKSNTNTNEKTSQISLAKIDDAGKRSNTNTPKPSSPPLKLPNLVDSDVVNKSAKSSTHSLDRPASAKSSPKEELVEDKPKGSLGIVPKLNVIPSSDVEDGSKTNSDHLSADSSKDKQNEDSSDTNRSGSSTDSKKKANSSGNKNEKRASPTNSDSNNQDLNDWYKDEDLKNLV